MVTARQILAPATDAGQSNPFFVPRVSSAPRRDGPPVTLVMAQASGALLTSNEYADVQVSWDGGTTWTDVYEDGVQLRLSATNNVVALYSLGMYRIDKEATTEAVGIWMFEPDLGR